MNILITQTSLHLVPELAAYTTPSGSAPVLGLKTVENLFSAEENLSFVVSFIFFFLDIFKSLESLL
jgi:hypothetical protein